MDLLCVSFYCTKAGWECAIFREDLLAAVSPTQARVHACQSSVDEYKVMHIKA